MSERIVRGETPAKLGEKIIEFARHEGAVSNFLLVGEPRDASAKYKVFVCLYPTKELSEIEGDYMVIGTDPKDAGQALEPNIRVLALSIPQRVKELGILDNPDVRETMMKPLIGSNYPYAVISFGHRCDTGEELVLLSTILGISPETALKEFQERALERIESLSSERRPGNKTV